MNIEVETLNEPFVLAISLDKASEEPLHQQISEPLRTMILNNELNPGQLLEDEVGMAKRLDTSRTTVRRAFQNLADAGLLSRQRGVGTRVTLPPIHRKVSLTSLFDDLKDAGLSQKPRSSSTRSSSPAQKQHRFSTATMTARSYISRGSATAAGAPLPSSPIFSWHLRRQPHVASQSLGYTSN